jgi:protein-disulfide isomerase
MSKGFWAIIGIIVVIFGGVLLFKGDEANAPSNGAALSNHVQGENAKDVELLEYADFQCPVCGQYYPMLKQVMEKYNADIQFRFRHLPITQIHQNAFAAARAAEAAGLQDKFWEMYDLIFQNQQAWSSSKKAQTIFEGYAQQLGLNMEQFKADFTSQKVNDTINADVKEFNKTGEDVATPTFFLDGKRIQPRSVEEFNQLIDEAIAKKNP